MREIKFRGRRIDNGEWVHGCLTRYSDYMSYITVDLVEGKVHQVLTATVGQYIGPKDDHNRGKEIYKSDIVRIEAACGEEYIGEVVWDESRLGWAVDCSDLEELYDFATIIHCEHLVEVIGNVHEHKYLLDPEIQKHICSGEPPF